MNKVVSSVLLSAVLIAGAAGGGCQPTLGPGEAWYTWRNDQNSFAWPAIDGKRVPYRLRPGDEGRYPLAVAVPHTVVIARGSYKPVIGSEYFRDEWEADVIDPPFVIRWAEGSGWERE